MSETETTQQQKQINPVTLLLLGLCLIFMSVGGYYYYKHQEAVKSEITTIAKDIPEEPVQVQTLPAPTPAVGEVVETIMEEAELGVVSGKVCFPGSYIPEGLVALKNLETDEVTTFPNQANQSLYVVKVPAGKYHARYQAYTNGIEGEYQSGYYTKCGIDSSYDVCNAPDAHVLIEVEIQNGGTVADVALCDFYYEKEPAF